MAGRPYHHGDLRNALLDSAEALIRERGADGWSLREASARIGVSPSAAYHHFDSRDALVRATYRTPFLLKGDFNRIDEARLKAALFRDATAIAGAGNVSGIAVVSQTAQHFIRQPQAAPAGRNSS